jgi:hypothetical protein
VRILGNDINEKKKKEEKKNIEKEQEILLTGGIPNFIPRQLLTIPN